MYELLLEERVRRADAKIFALESELASLKVAAKNQKTKIRAGVPASYSEDEEIKLMTVRGVWREEKKYARIRRVAKKAGLPVTGEMYPVFTEQQRMAKAEYDAKKRTEKKAAAAAGAPAPAPAAAAAE
jgi:hypothetical protein